MRVGMLRASLRVPMAHSLKEKRAPLKRLLARLRDKFNVAVAEVGAHDVHQRAEIGLAFVAVDGVHLDRQIAAALDFLYGNPDLPLLDVQRDAIGGPGGA